MNILAISQSKDVLGGANRSFLDVLYLLKNCYNHNIFVLSPLEGEFTKRVSRIPLDYLCHPYNQVSFVSLKDYKDPFRYIKSAIKDLQNRRFAKEIAKSFEQKNFDIIYINDTTNTVGYYLAKLLKLPFVWHFRGYNSTIRKYMLFDSVLHNDPDGVYISISNAMKKYMVETMKFHPNKIIVIHNGVENSGVIVDQPWELSIKDGFHIVQCGHLSQAKGQTESILAINELSKKGYKDIYLHLAGSPLISHGKSYKNNLKDLISKFKIEDQIIFEGEVKNMSLLRKFMNVELMCSVAEPFGRVTVEGMQAGLVVIGCDTGATPEIIDDGINGLLYHRGDYKQLASLIERVYRDHELGNRLSEGALMTTRRKFTMNENVREINKVLLSQAKNL